MHHRYAPIRGAFKKLAEETTIAELSLAVAEGKNVLIRPADQ
jgi:hypothetical protein